MGRGARPRVLVVDDDPAMRKMMSLRLQLEGFDVQLAEDGPQALVFISTFSPEVLICDVHLDGMSGLEVCRRLRTELGPHSNLGIILLTGLDENEQMRSVMSLGRIEYMKKPFHATRLRELILELAQPAHELTGRPSQMPSHKLER